MFTAPSKENNQSVERYNTTTAITTTTTTTNNNKKAEVYGTVRGRRPAGSRDAGQAISSQDSAGRTQAAEDPVLQGPDPGHVQPLRTFPAAQEVTWTAPADHPHLQPAFVRVASCCWVKQPDGIGSKTAC